MRKKLDYCFKALCSLAALMALISLIVILVHLIGEGWQHVTWDFMNRFPSRFAEKAGLKSAIFGSLWILVLTTLIAAPLGVLSALYLEEYAPQNKIWTRLLRINIANLAGMPSIVYGLLGLAVFVRFFAFDRSILAGSLTLSLLILPIIIISAQEAIRAVPASIREAGYALGARKWQVVLFQVFPGALPGIMTGIILALSRSIGESAPMIMMGALSYVAYVPTNIMDSFTVLPIQIFNWTSRPQAEFHTIAAAGILILLALLFSLNATASYIRQKYQQYKV